MIHKPLFYLATILVFISLSCRSSKEFPVHYKGDQIHFGQGGGFSGIVTHYVLLDDRRLFQKGDRDSLYTFITQWKKEFVHQMFDNYHLLRLDTITHYEPGDIYYFIEYHASDNTVHRIAWGRPGFQPDNNTVIFYNLLFRSTKSTP